MSTGDKNTLSPQAQIDAVIAGSTPKELVNTVIQERAPFVFDTIDKPFAVVLDPDRTFYMFNDDKSASGFVVELEQVIDRMVKGLGGISSTRYRFRMDHKPAKHGKQYSVIRAIDAGRLRFSDDDTAEDFLDDLGATAAGIYLDHVFAQRDDVMPRVREPWSFEGDVTGG